MGLTASVPQNQEMFDVPNQNNSTSLNNDAEQLPFDEDETDFENEDDPKKLIQKLTGKLSQELRTYNNNQDSPDSELNKYVAGMIIPQATKSLNSDDKENIIKKINTNDDNDDSTDDSNDMPMESLTNLKEIIDEMAFSLLHNDDDKSRKRHQNAQDKLPRQNPFTPNR